MRNFIFTVFAILLWILPIQAQTVKDGIDYFKLGFYDNAIEILEKSIDETSVNKGEAYYYIGMSELGNHDIPKAQDALGKCVANSKGTYFEFLASGIIALLNSDTKGAESYFSKAEKQYKSSAKIMVAIGEAYCIVDPLKYNDQIEKCIEKAEKKNIFDPDLYVLKGDIALTKGDDGLAAGFYEMASENSDSDGIIPSLKYAMLFSSHNPAYALPKIMECCGGDPSISSIIYKTYILYLMAANESIKARDAYKHYLSQYGGFSDDKIQYANLLLQNKDYPEALEIATEFLKLYPDNEQMKEIKQKAESVLK